jgi:hypothetical protein
MCDVPPARPRCLTAARLQADAAGYPEVRERLASLLEDAKGQATEAISRDGPPADPPPPPPPPCMVAIREGRLRDLAPPRGVV